jgi:ATP-dependent DNA helicase MPH1
MEASLNMCYTCLKEATDGVVSDESGKTKSSKTAKGQLKGDSAFLSLMSEIEMMRSRVGGFGPHPKMEVLKMLMIQHFGLRMEDEGREAQEVQEAQETRAMVFVTNRGCVDELVEWLNLESPLLRATKFVGQGTDKQGKKGFAQKEQLEAS